MKPEVRGDKPHRNLIAWQKSMDLVIEVYRATISFPSHEIYGLTSQLRRAVVSAPSNIAEGAADRTVQQFYNFLSNAIGSLNEVDTQLELAFRLGYLSQEQYQRLHELLNECLALTYGLRKSLKKMGSRK
ncbi:MAG: four helix bundle protein [Thermodesulfobacteriota bacterium]